MSDFSSPVVTCRPALPSDKEDVVAFCQNIWDGHDYIPSVWDEWLADATGEMFVASYRGHAVGLTRMTHLAPGQWWFEGMRIDPAHQDKKLGTALNDYLNQHWVEHGDGKTRLLTNWKNVKVHHMCEQNGFVKIGDRASFTAPALDSVTDAFVPAEPADIPEMLELLQSAESTRMQGGLIETGWRYVTPNEKSLREMFEWKDGRLLWWRGRQGLLLGWDDDEETVRPFAGAIACVNADLPALLTDFRSYMGQQGHDSAFVFSFLLPEYVTLLEQAGFVRASENSAFVYEKIHPSRP